MVAVSKEFLKYVISEAFKKYNYNVIDRLQLVKLSFMIDCLRVAHGLKPITDYSYIKHNLGPFDGTPVSEAEQLVKEGILMQGDNYYEYILVGEIASSVSLVGVTPLELKRVFELAKDTNEMLNVVENLHKVKNTEFCKPIEVTDELAREFREAISK